MNYKESRLEVIHSAPGVGTLEAWDYFDHAFSDHDARVRRWAVDDAIDVLVRLGMTVGADALREWDPGDPS